MLIYETREEGTGDVREVKGDVKSKLKACGVPSLNVETLRGDSKLDKQP